MQNAQLMRLAPKLQHLKHLADGNISTALSCDDTSVDVSPEEGKFVFEEMHSLRPAFSLEVHSGEKGQPQQATKRIFWDNWTMETKVARHIIGLSPRSSSSCQGFEAALPHFTT